MEDARRPSGEVAAGAGRGPAEPAGRGVGASARRTRRIRWGATVTLTVLLLAAWGRLLVVDGPLPDDADLVHEPVDAAPEGNGWLLLAARAPELERIDVIQWFRVQPPSPVIEPESLGFVRERSAEWPDSAAAAAAHEFLGSIDAAFALVDEFLSSACVVIPFDPDGTTEGYHIGAIRTLGLCLQFRSRVAAIEGRTDDAIDDCLRMLDVGARYRLAENGALVHRVMGAATERHALVELFRILDAGNVDEARLGRIAGRLAEPAGADAAIESALRREYTLLRGAILATPRSATFKPHRTLSVLAQSRRELLRSLQLPYYRRDSRRASESLGAWGRVLAALGGNGAGALYASMEPDMQSLLEPHHAALFVRRAASVAVASMRHRLRTGELTASLDALVPELLPALPVDPFTHGPIRYDPVRGVLWSPGADSVDRGGTVSSNTVGELIEHDPVEPTVRIPRS